jgi:hypothetical protein
MKKHNFTAAFQTKLEKVRPLSPDIPEGVARCYLLRPDLTAQLYMSPISEERLDTARRNPDRLMKQLREEQTSNSDD